MKDKLNWFDKMMIGVTYAEANMEEPDLQHFDPNDSGSGNRVQKQEEGYEPFDGEAVPAQ